ncbi:olfactory receptor 5V1-like [Bombina bombina]|uniref:olfactory receptor 5V1-like n=1 Tax=Bombina bombina TaxID=8345 RepID=UPI00235AEADB|nr:olfactory receptor 5V1-like [Bombina bombina]
MDNQTNGTDFYIMAFTFIKDKSLLCILFSLFYSICLLWNILMIVVINMDRQLQTPMYFFLSNLSFVDLSYISVTIPKLMDIFITGNMRISFIGCFVQLYFFAALVITEILLLTAMAYDRFVAICKPLHYMLIMKKVNCVLLVAGSWICGYGNSIFSTTFASYLSFCGSKHVNYLFCDIKVLTKISCGGTKELQTMIYIEALIMGLCPFLLIIVSYSKIVAKILAMHSVGNRQNAFSTCTAHLGVLFMFYGTLLCIYMSPPSENSEDLDHIFAVFYLAVTPTINPLIYSLRNKDIMIAIKKTIIWIPRR